MQQDLTPGLGLMRGVPRSGQIRIHGADAFEGMRRAGRLAAETLDFITPHVQPGITTGELERSKTRMIADSVYAQDSQTALARWYGAALSTGSTVQQVRTWPDRIRVVGADAVQDAARTWLSHGRSVTGYLVKKLPQPPEKRS